MRHISPNRSSSRVAILPIEPHRGGPNAGIGITGRRNQVSDDSPRQLFLCIANATQNHCRVGTRRSVPIFHRDKQHTRVVSTFRCNSRKCIGRLNSKFVALEQPDEPRHGAFRRFPEEAEDSNNTRAQYNVRIIELPT